MQHFPDTLELTGPVILAHVLLLCAYSVRACSEAKVTENEVSSAAEDQHLVIGNDGHRAAAWHFHALASEP